MSNTIHIIYIRNVGTGTTLGGTLNVVGASTLVVTTITGGLVVTGGSLNVGTGTTLDGTLNVVGASTLAVTTIVGGLVVTGGSLNVGTAASLGGTLNVVGASTLAVTTIVGGLVVTGGSLNVGGKIVIENSSTGINMLVRCTQSITSNLAGIGFGVTPLHIIKGAIIHERTGGNGSGTLHLANRSGTDGGNVSLADAKLSIVNSGEVKIVGTIHSTSTNTGALQVVGGIGIGGNINACTTSATHVITSGIGGTTLIANSSGKNHLTSDITSGVANQLTATGNAGYNYILASGASGSNQLSAQNNFIVGNIIQQTTTTESISATTGALQVTGGVGIAKNLFVGKDLTVVGNTRLSYVNDNLHTEFGSSTGGTSQSFIDFHSNNGATVTDYDTRIISIGGSSVGTHAKGRLEFEALNSVFTTVIESTSTNTGTLQVRGGLGVSGNVYARAYFATSDIRLKTNVTNINIPSLDILRKIQPRKYDHIDTQSSEPTYGFIAQEVKRILPNAVSFNSDYIPSIYEMAFIDNRTITLINKSTTDISMCAIKLLDNTRNEIISNVIQILDNKKIIIDTTISDYLTHKTDISGNILTFTIRNGSPIYMRGSEEYTGLVKKCIFVYGHYIPDFHVINKDTIWTVTLSATKEIDAQLQLANSRIAEQYIRIANLEQTIRRQQADIDAILKRLR